MAAVPEMTAPTRAVRACPAERADGWPPATFLGGLPEADLRALLDTGTTRRHGRGSALVREGEPPGDVFVVLRGCVKVLGDTDGGRTTLLALRVPGEVVGELSAIDGRARSATAVAVVPTATRRIGRGPFRAYLDEHPAAAAAMYRSVADKLRLATRLRIDFGGAPVPVRLARVLAYLATYGRPVRSGLLIDVPLSQADLAALLGAAEPSVHRGLAELRREGLLSTGYRRLVITDPTRLRTLASGA